MDAIINFLRNLLLCLVLRSCGVSFLAPFDYASKLPISNELVRPWSATEQDITRAQLCYQGAPPAISRGRGTQRRFVFHRNSFCSTLPCHVSLRKCFSEGRSCVTVRTRVFLLYRAQNALFPLSTVIYLHAFRVQEIFTVDAQLSGNQHVVLLRAINRIMKKTSFELANASLLRGLFLINIILIN